MSNQLSDKLLDLAGQLTYAASVKDVARLRRQVDLSEWTLVKAEAKRIVALRKVEREYNLPK